MAPRPCAARRLRTPPIESVAARSADFQGRTSAVAPLWAGLIALANAGRGTPIPRMHRALYGDAALLRRITSGNNKAGPLGYDASDGWNPCAGLGVPIGRAILAKLTAVACGAPRANHAYAKAG